MTDPKAVLRAEARAARRALSPGQRRRASSVICDRLLALDEVAAADTVLAYAAMSDEVDPSAAVAAILARGGAVRFPRVEGPRLAVVPVTDLGELVPGFGGIHEPGGAAVSPADLDLILVPGLAFDRRGGRLGHGGGHYDRLLATLDARVVRVGLAFGAQLVDTVPTRAHDRPVDAVVTEDGVVRFA